MLSADADAVAYRPSRQADTVSDTSMNMITNNILITEGPEVPECSNLKLSPSRFLATSPRVVLSIAAKQQLALKFNSNYEMVSHVNNYLRLLNSASILSRRWSKYLQVASF
jgi:hypothetical protein|eukprot:COSAG01_NODE_4883_length_4654_cov_4.488694_5_plen_111_part_00